MDNDLGEFVGKGFAMLRDRLKAVEAREALDGIDGQDGQDGNDGLDGKDGIGTDGKDGVDGKDGLNGKDGNSIKGDKGNEGKSIRGEKGDQGDQGKAGKAGEVGPKAKDGIDGTDGKDGKDATATNGIDGEGIASAIVDTRGHLIITLDSGRKIDAGKVKGKDAQSYQGMIAGGPSTPRPSGIATLDFGASNKTATFVVTGVSAITANSVVLVKMRIEDTDDHAAEDLLVDPIRVEAFAIVAGVGFTIYGTMQNAPANGKYNVQWALV
tara:strand:- start:86 stop:889 length:804 start_codon:yes stop_codon:yes gene_type:complete